MTSLAGPSSPRSTRRGKHVPADAPTAWAPVFGEVQNVVVSGNALTVTVPAIGGIALHAAAP